MAAYRTEPSLVCEKVIERMLSISRTTLYRYRRNGKLPYYKVGRKILYSYEEVVECLKV